MFAFRTGMAAKLKWAPARCPGRCPEPLHP